MTSTVRPHEARRPSAPTMSAISGSRTRPTVRIVPKSGTQRRESWIWGRVIGFCGGWLAGTVTGGGERLMGSALSTSTRLRCRTWGSAWAFSRSARLRVPRLRRDCLAVPAYTWSILAPNSTPKREPSLTGALWLLSRTPSLCNCHPTNFLPSFAPVLSSGSCPGRSPLSPLVSQGAMIELGVRQRSA